MLKIRRAPSPENSSCSANQDPFFDWPMPPRPVTTSSALPRPFVRRLHSPESGRALEILGHAIEYLSDEYANDLASKGPLGSADPRVAAIQTLKGLNRAVYYSGTEVQPAFSRMRRWLQDSRIMGR
jgi:hypothetical protein